MVIFSPLRYFPHTTARLLETVGCHFLEFTVFCYIPSTTYVPAVYQHGIADVRFKYVFSVLRFTLLEPPCYVQVEYRAASCRACFFITRGRSLAWRGYTIMFYARMVGEDHSVSRPLALYYYYYYYYYYYPCHCTFPRVLPLGRRRSPPLRFQV
jgi:hypothetical protein